jgi:CRP/FNR family transcriptional regulator, cyclic AMP receptor protein
MNFFQLFDDWANTETHRAGSVIFSDKEPADALFLVLKGEVALSLRGDALSTEGRGALIGEMAIIEDAPRSETATAVDTVRLARISPKEFRDLVADNPEFSLHAMAELARRLRAVDALLSSRID